MAKIDMSRIRVKQIRSAAGRLENHKSCLRGLGLGRVGRVSELEDTLAVRGMIRKVSYLVSVEELS